MSTNFTNKEGTGIITADGFATVGGGNYDNLPKLITKGLFIFPLRSITSKRIVSIPLEDFPTIDVLPGDNVQLFFTNPDPTKFAVRASTGIMSVIITIVNISEATASFPSTAFRYVVFR